MQGAFHRWAEVEWAMTKRVAGVETPSPLPEGVSLPAHDPPAEAFGRHFLRCFICHIGDRYEADHFCETGRELIIAMLDEIAEKDFRANEVAESRLIT